MDYEYIKNHYRQIAVDLSRQKELDADPKAIQHIEFVGQLKNDDDMNADVMQSMFVLTILEKNQRNEVKIFSRKCKSLIKHGQEDDQEARVKLTNTQLNKLKSEPKNKTGTKLRITKKNFLDKELPHKLLLTRRQKSKIRNTFTINMSMDTKPSNTQFSKTIQSGESLGKKLGDLGKKSIIRPY